MRLGTYILLLSLVFFLPAPVCAQQTVVIGSDAAPPLSTSQQTGMLDLVVKEAFTRIGVRAEITALPSERSLLNANGGLTDGDLVRIAGLSQHYPHLIAVPEITCTFDFVAFSTRSDFHLSGWESLKPYSVGIITGWKILEENVHASPLTKVADPTLLFGLLQHNRADMVIYNRLEGYGLIKQQKLQGIVVLEPPLKSNEMFLYLHEKHAAIIPQLAAAMRQMKADGTYQKIVNETLKAYLP